ncbi:unnamed protein product [Brassicogethes aeneus]|uniref:Fatty acid hydroxylase domain-containing protein n=1 Tax=Brassicogethes aeneus TaxID=1431903 RepID=A0A9P0AZI9_BRAAE|nr:unnamed protein product [Brassicogethes aeneus]
MEDEAEPKKENGLYDPMAVRWSEKYSDTFNKLWSYVPSSFKNVVVTLAVFLVGISLNGNWINIFIHLRKQLGYTNDIKSSITFSFDNFIYTYFKGFTVFFVFSLIVSYCIYLFVGGFLHWYYYVRQRDKAEEWKIQPTKFLSPELERHEILLGSFTLFLNATTSALLACYISNGGYSTVYYNFSEYGWLWYILQWPVVFIYMDYVTYWLHRMYHLPCLYKRFHKLHHKYKQPTAFSVTAIHPFEALHIQLTLVVPLFAFPVHWMTFYLIAIYNYYHGIIDHSGINFKSYWWQPWQPDAIFHDNHHQYFHVNFSFNIEYWDKLHGTYRKKDRVYTEEIFYGTGKSIKEVSAEELKADLEERKSENPLAFRGDKSYYELSEKDLNKFNKQF